MTSSQNQNHFNSICTAGFFGAALLALTIGFGVSFSGLQVLNTLFVRPLSIPAPGELVQLQHSASGLLPHDLSYSSFSACHQNASAFSSLLAHLDAQVQLHEDPGRQIHVRFVTDNYFAELGARPLLGRLLQPRMDDKSAQTPIAVLSYGLWNSELHADRAVADQTILVNRTPVQIVGVAPADFCGLRPARVELWLPLAHYEVLVPGGSLNNPQTRVQAFARLATGVTPEAAAASLRADNPDAHFALAPAGHALQLSRRHLPALAGGLALILFILVSAGCNFGALHVACRFSASNTRSSAPVFRFSIRVLPTCLLAGAAGLLLSIPGGRLLLQFLGFDGALQSALDWRIIVLAAVLCFLLAVFSAVAHAFRTVLVVAQLAGACGLLIVAVYSAFSFYRVRSQGPGFDYELAVVAEPISSSSSANEERLLVLKQRALAVPGIRSAALCGIAPLRRPASTEDSGAPHASTSAYANVVEPEYFDALRIPIVSGRNFHPGDADAVILSESMARNLFTNRSPLGQRYGSGAIIIGIAGDIRTTPLGRAAKDQVYYPYKPGNSRMPAGALVIRTAFRPAALLPSLRNVLAPSGDPPVRLTHLLQPFEAEITHARQSVFLISLGAALAVMLSASGVLGLWALRNRPQSRGA